MITYLFFQIYGCESSNKVQKIFNHKHCWVNRGIESMVLSVCDSSCGGNNFQTAFRQSQLYLRHHTINTVHRKAASASPSTLSRAYKFQFDFRRVHSLLSFNFFARSLSFRLVANQCTNTVVQEGRERMRIKQSI